LWQPALGRLSGRESGGQGKRENFLLVASFTRPLVVWRLNALGYWMRHGLERVWQEATKMVLESVLIWQGGGVAGLGGFLIPLMLMFGIMYFLVIMPQQRQRKKVQEMLSAIKNGDKVVTTSGIYGTINGMDGDTIILKIADNVKIRIARTAIAQVEATDDAK
jgi:preprotein translocase subunit YajC